MKNSLVSTPCRLNSSNRYPAASETWPNASLGCSADQAVNLARAPGKFCSYRRRKPSINSGSVTNAGPSLGTDAAAVAGCGSFLDFFFNEPAAASLDMVRNKTNEIAAVSARRITIQSLSRSQLLSRIQLEQSR